jgi:hypothetical protein
LLGTSCRQFLINFHLTDGLTLFNNLFLEPRTL